MTLASILNILRNPISFGIYFLVLGILAIYILESAISLQTIMGTFIFLMILVIIASRIIFSQKLTKNALGKIGLLPIAFFIYLLVLSTGGLSSQFIILTHFFSIALAFLFSPQISTSYVGATLALLLFIITQKPHQQFLADSPFVISLYFIAYIALIPFAYIIAREYKVKEEWAKILEEQIATSKAQEEDLLKNITDSIIVLNTKLEIAYTNKATIDILGFGNEIIGKDLFKVFSFRDKEGRALQPYSLPLAQTLDSRAQFTLEDIQIQNKQKQFVRFDIKILPIIQQTGPLGLMLVLRNRSLQEQAAQKKQTTALLSLARFLSFLNDQKRKLEILQGKTPQRGEVNYILKENAMLENIASDFIYVLRLESGEIGALSSLIDLGQLTEDLLLDLKSQAKQKNLTLLRLTPQKQTPLVQPKGNLRLVREKETFPKVYIIGNIVWLKDGLMRIFELIFLLSQTGKEVGVQVDREEGQGVIRIFAPIYTFWGASSSLMPELFEKFYGKLRDWPELAGSTGLEGYIAKSLIERMGGSLRFENRTRPPALAFTITFGLKEVN